MPKEADRSEQTTDLPAQETGVEAAGNTHSHRTPAGSPKEPDPPTVIGPYRVIECLGRGGQGEVYRAVHPTLGRDVVIKVGPVGVTAEQRKRLFEEGRVLARLEDPGLVRVYDANLHEGRPYVVFEYVKGRSLAEKVRKKALPVRDAVRLVARIAGIVERVHQEGVLHRDLKPANVLIDVHGTPRLLDFGLACMSVPYVASETEVGVSGTPAYMSPEQANGENEPVATTDVFGLGAILYDLLTGRPPHEGGSAKEVWDKAKRGRVKSVRSRNAAIPKSLDLILATALAPEPEDRYQSAGEFAAALGRFLRRPRMVLLGVAAGVVLLATVAVIVAQPGKTREATPPSVASNPQVPVPVPNPKPQPQPIQTPPVQPGPKADPPFPKPVAPLAGWQVYRSDDGFAVNLPVAPKVESGEGKGLAYRTATAIDKKSGLAYSIASSDNTGKIYPQPYEALRKSRDEGLANIGAVVSTEREITFGRYPGLDSYARVQAGKFKGCWVQTRLYLVRNRLYMQMVIGQEMVQRPDDPEATNFLDSFQLTPAKD